MALIGADTNLDSLAGFLDKLGGIMKRHGWSSFKMDDLEICANLSETPEAKALSADEAEAARTIAMMQRNTPTAFNPLEDPETFVGGAISFAHVEPPDEE